MEAVPKSEIVNLRYLEKMGERKSLLTSVRTDYTKATADLDMLKAKVIKALRGKRLFKGNAEYPYYRRQGQMRWAPKAIWKSAGRL